MCCGRFFFLARYLKNGEPRFTKSGQGDGFFETVVNPLAAFGRWRRAEKLSRLYLQAGFGLSFEKSGVGGATVFERWRRLSFLTPT